MRRASEINYVYEVRACKDRRSVDLFQTIRQSQNLLLLFLLTTLFGFSGCVEFAKSFGEPVTVAPGDTTPPNVELRIPALGITLHRGDAPQTIHVNSINGEFFAMGFAEDPQGVQSISVLGAYDDRCSFEGVSSISSDNGAPGAAYSNQATAGQTATTILWIPYLVEPRRIHCEPGYDGSFTLELWATAKNFSGQTATTGRVRFTSP
jgi:hypothetical protein